MTVEEMLSLRVDREAETAECMDALLQKRNNVLVFGERGVGKTFLLRILQHELSKHRNVFMAFVSTSAMFSLGNEDPIASFSRLVLQQLCACIWEDILGGSYLDLRSTLGEGKQDITLRGKGKDTVQQVYAHLMTYQQELRYEMSNSVGFSAGAKGEKKEQFRFQRQQADVLPFELAKFAEGLIANVLLPKGKDRTIILCDEANLMPLFFQEEILNRYFELFSNPRLQFVFVAGLVPWEKCIMPNCFETTIELSGFPDIKHLREFIHKINSTSIETCDDALSLLFQTFLGHPRYSLAVYSDAHELAVGSGTGFITLEIMQAACKENKRQLAEYERTLRQAMKDEYQR